MMFYLCLVMAMWTGINTMEDTCRTNGKYRVNSTLECGCCSPGFYKEADCTQSDQSAKCMACPPGDFSLYANQATSCQPCSPSCTLKYTEVVKNCTSRSDIACECQAGFYMRYRSPSEGICAPHSKCQPGFYVQKLGTSIEDTTCTACPPKTYLNTENLESACKNCSTCSDPSGETIACSRIKDAECNDKPTYLDEQKNGAASPGVIVGAVIGAMAVVVAVVIVVVVCHRQGRHIPCLKVTRRERCEELQEISTHNGHTKVDHGEQQEVVRPSENGQHEYALISPNTENSPRRDKPSRRTQVERSWEDLSLLLQKELPISDWKFVIRELYATVRKSADRILEEHEANHPRNVKEQIYCCLKSFGESTDLCKYDFHKLTDILCNHDYNELAGKIQKDDRFRPLLPGDNNTEHGDVPRTQ